MANPFPFSVGAVLTAAQMNSIGEAGTVFTPTWSSSGTQPTIGNGSLIGRYMRVNKLVYVSMQLTIGSTTNVGTGAFLFGFPVTAAATPTNFGTMPNGGFLYDNSAGTGYNLVNSYNAGSTANFRVAVFQNGTQTFVLLGAGNPIVLATNDDIFVSYVYEAA
jgi:hypothetical protein